MSKNNNNSKSAVNEQAEKALNEAVNAGQILKHRTLASIYGAWTYVPNYAVIDALSHPANPRKKLDISKLEGSGPVHRATVVYAGPAAIAKYGKPVILQGHLRFEYSRRYGFTTIPAYVIDFDISAESEMAILLDHNAETALRDIMEGYNAVAAGLSRGLTLTQIERQCTNVFMTVFTDCTKKLEAKEAEFRKSHGIGDSDLLSHEEMSELEQIKRTVTHSAYWGRLQQMEAIFNLPDDIKNMVFAMWEAGQTPPYAKLVALNGKFKVMREKFMNTIMNEGDMPTLLQSLNKDLHQTDDKKEQAKIQSAIEYAEKLVEEGNVELAPLSSNNYPITLKEEAITILTTPKEEKEQDKRRAKDEYKQFLGIITDFYAQQPAGPKKAYYKGVIDGIKYMTCLTDNDKILAAAQSFDAAVIPGDEVK